LRESKRGRVQKGLSP